MAKTLCLIIFICTAVQSAETDNFTNRFVSRPSSHFQLNVDVNRILQNSEWQTKKIENCDKNELTELIAKKFKSFGVSKFEKLVKNSNRYHKFNSESSIYSGFLEHFALHSISPSMKFHDYNRNVEYIVGADKLSHFFTEGFNYYNIIRKKGALKNAIGYGIWLEEGFWGKKSTGVYSYGDMVANLEGFLFYARLSRGPKPYFICRDNSFRINPTVSFDIMDYASEAWDEGINCNKFRNYKLSLLVKRYVKGLGKIDPVNNYQCPISKSGCDYIKSRYKGLLLSKLVSPKCR